MGKLDVWPNSGIGSAGMSVGARLKAAREKLGLSAYAIAQRAELKPNTVTRIESGETRSPGIDTLERLARAVEVDVESLLVEPVTVVSNAADAQRVSVAVPLVAEDVAAGSGSLPVDVEEERMLAFREAWLRARGWRESDPDRFCCVRLGSANIAESMLPTIQPRSVLLIDRKADRRRIKPRDIWLVQDDEGGISVKRITVRGQTLILESDNPDPRYAAQWISLKERPIEEVARGRVVWYATELD